METIETLAILAAAAASSLALALLMQWMALRALFHVMPRRAAKELAKRGASIHPQLHPAGSRAA